MAFSKLNMTRFQHIVAEENRWKAHPEELAAKAPSWHRHKMRSLPDAMLNGDPKYHHIIKGPRQSGKSSLMWQTLQVLHEKYNVPQERLTYIQMDHPELERENLGAVVEALLELYPDASSSDPLFLFVDEIASSEGWQGWLKMFSDAGKPVRILASSSAFAFSKNGDSGIGRWKIHYLMPCNFLEFIEIVHHSSQVIPKWCWTWYPTLQERLEAVPLGIAADNNIKSSLLKMMLIGGYPECIASFGRSDGPEYNATVAAHKYLEDISHRVCSQDIQGMTPIRDSRRMRWLLHACARFMCTQTAPSTVGREADLKTADTAISYMSLLEDSDLMFRLRAYANPEPDADIGISSKRASRNQKIAFRDTAMAAAVRRSGVSSIADASQKGWVYENMVAAALRELADYASAELNYWRKENRYEVDFIYDTLAERPIAVEVASSSGHDKTGLRKAIQEIPRLQNNAYLVSPDTPIIQAKHSVDGIAEMPLDIFLLAANSQALQVSLLQDGHTQGRNWQVTANAADLFSRPLSGQPAFSEGDIVYLTEAEAKAAKDRLKPAE